jgi:hypothetical protein
MGADIDDEVGRESEAPNHGQTGRHAIGHDVEDRLEGLAIAQLGEPVAPGLRACDPGT